MLLCKVFSSIRIMITWIQNLVFIFHRSEITANNKRQPVTRFLKGHQESDDEDNNSDDSDEGVL